MKNSFKDLIHQYGILLNLIIMSIGIILIILSILIGLTREYGQILMSVGASIVASTVVTIITTKYLFKHSRIKEIVEKWGLKGIFRTRAEMNIETDVDLKMNKKELNIVAFGLKSFRQTCNDIIIDKIKEGMKLRILTISPGSLFLKEREKAEERKEGSIKLDILNLYKWVNELKKYQIKDDQISIRFYDSLPIDFFFGLDSAVYMGPYLYGYESQQTISYSFKKNSEGYDYYSSYFIRLWNNQEFCKELVLKDES